LRLISSAPVSSCSYDDRGTEKESINAAWLVFRSSWPRTGRLGTRPRSRGAMRPSCAKNLLPLITEGAGNAGCPLHPQPRVQSVQSTRVSHHRFTGTPGILFPSAILDDRLRRRPPLLPNCFRVSVAGKVRMVCNYGATHKSSLIGAGLTSVRYAPVATKFRIAAT